MDEHREERGELAALARAERDDAREAAEARAYWDDAGHAERVALDTARWSLC